MCFNYWLASTPILPPAPFAPPLPSGLPSGVQSFSSDGSSLQFRIVPSRTFDHLIAFDFGLLAFAPWAMFAFWAIARTGGRSKTNRDQLAIIFFPVFFYFLQLTLAGLTAHLTPGYCYGPRYWVALLPWLAIAYARLFQGNSGRARWGLASVALAGAVISLSGALRYPHLFREPFYASLSMRQAETLR